MPKTIALRAITNLIVILHEHNKFVRRESEHRSSMAAAATLRINAVVNEPARKTFRELRDRSEIAKVTGRLARQDGVQRVMKIVVPLRVQAVAACLARRDD